MHVTQYVQLKINVSPILADYCTTAGFSDNEYHDVGVATSHSPQKPVSQVESYTTVALVSGHSL